MSPLDKQREKLLRDYYEARKNNDPVMYEFARELFGWPFNMVVSELEREYQRRLKEEGK
jgi:predicted component of type VI protein secretion system